MENRACSKHRDGNLASVEECSEKADLTTKFSRIERTNQSGCACRDRRMQEPNDNEQGEPHAHLESSPRRDREQLDRCHDPRPENQGRVKRAGVQRSEDRPASERWHDH